LEGYFEYGSEVLIKINGAESFGRLAKARKALLHGVS
jgi:hypothetical protein